MSLYDIEPGWRGIAPPSDPLEFMREPVDAFRILSCEGQFTEVSMCGFCENRHGNCPAGATRQGLCTGYILEGADAHDIDTRIESHLVHVHT